MCEIYIPKTYPVFFKFLLPLPSFHTTWKMYLEPCKQVGILIFKNQVLRALYLKHHIYKTL